MIGETIAHYRITALLGQGGMGAVYRAADTKLQREVAIKVLPETFAAHPDRLARFTREAQVLASLNHPNIGAIYGVEERALVLELIEGPTLADRIAKAALTWDEALPLIRQLIDAIDFAHLKGVIHRDLKPANIKVTPEGQLKVLDFGLGKALDSTSAATTATDMANSPTLTLAAPGTAAGMILGTAAYMAPEQARGKTVDKRADIWAFGVVVWEMLTGQQLFQGETVTDTLAQTLTKEVDFAQVPAPARPLLRRCLDRDLKMRLRDLGDANDLLRPTEPVAILPSTVRRPIWWMAGVGVSLVAALAFGLLWQRAEAQRKLPPLIRMSMGSSYLESPMSPDGSAVVQVEFGGGLRLRRLDELTGRLLPGTEGATRIFWSGDSSAIGFFVQGKLCIMPLSTGEVRVLATAPQPGGGTWRGSASSGDIVYVTQGKLMHFSLAQAVARPIPVTLPAEQQLLMNPAFLPEGDSFVFPAGPLDGRPRTLYRLSLQGGAATPLMAINQPPRFARHPHNGQWHMFYALPGKQALMTVPIDPASGQPAGDATQLVQAVGQASTSGRFAGEVGGAGHMVFRVNAYSVPVYKLRWFSRDGQVLATLGENRSSNDLALSPDESQIAQVAGYPTRSVLIVDSRSGNARRLSRAADNAGQGVVWSPSGQALFYSIERPDGGWNIVRHAADGASAPQVVGQMASALTLMDISPDGQYLLLGPIANGGAAAYFRLSLKPNPGPPAQPEIWLNSGPHFQPRGAQARFSPDGKWIFAPAQPDGHFLPWRDGQPVPAGPYTTVPFLYTSPFFTPDGRLCGVSREKASLVCHSLTATAGLPPVLGPPKVAVSAAIQLTAFGKEGAVTKDGRILLLVTDEPEVAGMQFISDWTALLPGGRAASQQ